MNSAIGTPPIITDHREGEDTIAKRAHYSPPWADVSIIGIAGSSGSGKTTLSHAIVNNLNLPWVVIMSMVRAVPPEEIDQSPCSPVPGFILQTTRCCLLQAGISKRVRFRRTRGWSLLISALPVLSMLIRGIPGNRL